MPKLKWYPWLSFVLMWISGALFTLSILGFAKCL